jgi:hypothetical protein
VVELFDCFAVDGSVMTVRDQLVESLLKKYDYSDSFA